ncbi:hypothetical protein JTE90_029523 [Oedothorax gibbosus]|uniref:TNFR-Cys domain-containing protein n=1 Tax=Oedothorax gibbosus TaxID=931172 RepID=A0AAV6VB16_9ARAC|nr:hypothetical protein JTE90_029523 [Oedothorax gibbosus]
MFFSAAVVLAIVSQQLAHGTSLCKEKEWFNHLTDKCQECRVCPEKFLEMAPCIEFQDAMCVDLKEIAKSIKDGASNHQWHEMEGDEDNEYVFQKSGDVLLKQKIQSKPKFDEIEGMWSQVILVVLCLSFISLAVFAVMMALKCSGRFSSRENSKTIARARLFSRDRLNTTEYMNNLATLDRRLAMDEILEKKKRAVFEPQLLNENVYSDEVFVDISGLPRNLRSNLPELEELDNRRCLLQMQDR